MREIAIVVSIVIGFLFVCAYFKHAMGKPVLIIFQNTGGTTNVAFGQASMDASGQRQMAIAVGDRQALDSILTRAGLDVSDLNDLTEAIQGDGDQKPGRKVEEWVKTKASKIISGGVKVGSKIGQEILTAWLMQHYGLKQ